MSTFYDVSFEYKVNQDGTWTDYTDVESEHWEHTVQMNEETNPAYKHKIAMKNPNQHLSAFVINSAVTEIKFRVI